MPLALLKQPYMTLWVKDNRFALNVGTKTCWNTYSLAGSLLLVQSNAKETQNKMHKLWLLIILETNTHSYCVTAVITHGSVVPDWPTKLILSGSTTIFNSGKNACRCDCLQPALPSVTVALLCWAEPIISRITWVRLSVAWKQVFSVKALR